MTEVHPPLLKEGDSLQSFDPDHSIIVLEDEDFPLLVDISLCLDERASSPWLRECNTTAIAVGYVDVVDMILEDVGTFTRT